MNSFNIFLLKTLISITFLITIVPLFCQTSILILGIAQDGGYPQVGCKKSCCQKFTNKKYAASHTARVSSIAIIDDKEKKSWIIDATPDFPRQVEQVHTYSQYDLSGILLTHAHIGHYTGLMYTGREVMGATKLPVYIMPRMLDYLQSNGPWSQLVQLKNIELRPIQDMVPIPLSFSVKVTPIRVPHREEYSETVGYLIESAKKLLYIPDIDKWSKWDQSIIEWVKKTDHVLIDGTFYANGEIWGRDMSEIPHPFITESMSLFDPLPAAEKSKIKFIHLNHTNPVLRSTTEKKQVLAKGYTIAHEGEIIRLD